MELDYSPGEITAVNAPITSCDVERIFNTSIKVGVKTKSL